MSFLRHLLPAWKRQLQGSSANAAILSALNRELTEAEQDAIEGKIVMSLESATGRWLDQYGDLFGVIRKDNEIDDVYRRRIINYVLLKRGTIPAIKDAIREFLQDFESHIEIYEPYNNIFFLNRSKLNGKDHFLGEYYTFAVIDIKFARAFPPDIIDIINEFKPAGVRVFLTYRPSAYNPKAPIVELPLASSEIQETNTRLSIMNGMNDRIRGHLNLTSRARHEDDSSGIFIVNRSKLNSLDRLTGSFSVHNPTYNLASYSVEDLTFGTNTPIEDVLNDTEPMSQDFYTRTGQLDDQYATKTIDTQGDSYIYMTLDMATYFGLSYPTYLREVSPSGVYTKQTYLELIESPVIQYRMRTTTTLHHPVIYNIQLLNLDTGKWNDVDSGFVRYSDMADSKAKINSLAPYLSETGLVFTRIKLFTNPDTESYDLQLYFYELGFKKEIAVRPTAQPYDAEVTSSTSLIPV